MAPDITFIALGALFLAGLAADMLGRRTKLPRVTILLVLGMLIGTPGLDLVAGEIGALYDILSIIALTMVAFLLGSSLRIETLRQRAAWSGWRRHPIGAGCGT